MSAPEERRAQVAFEAAEWLVRCDEGPLSATEKTELEGWLRESPLHVAEFLSASRVRRELAGFRAWHDVGGTPAADESTVATLFPGIVAADTRRASPADLPAQRPTSRRVAAWAAAVLLCLAVPGLIWHSLSPQQLSTATGEKREVTLADGSIIRLLPESRLQVDYDDTQRRVHLSQGAALFRVTKDARRPFIVDAGPLSVRAVGTIFSVQRLRDAEVVTVQEGRVMVATSGSAAPASTPTAAGAVPLQANQRLAVTPRGELGPVKEIAGIPAPPAEVFDWYSRHIVFTDAPVAEVVEDFNRRNHRKIRVLDPAVGAHQVTGSFDDDDPRSFAAFLGTIPGVEVAIGDEEITVDSRPDATPSGRP